MSHDQKPPTQTRALYITPEGEKKLRDELKYLWKVKRPQVTESVREAAALGDRSENAEYIYGKKQLREIDRRVRYLDKRLDLLTVVHRPPSDRSKIFFGAWVTLIDEEGVQHRYRIAGADESDLSRGYISIDTPLARALLKREAGDEVEVATPGGKRYHEVIAIEYEEGS